MEQTLTLSTLFFAISFLYASVGFGGGSSYLAILSLLIPQFYSVRSVALLCNFLVVGGNSYLYFKNKVAQLNNFVPFVITSVPMAFWGASMRLQEKYFFTILGVALLVSAFSLVWQVRQSSAVQQEKIKHYHPFLPYVLGAGIGFLSGLVGIGGGIFLSPLLNHLRFDKSIKISALASFFILVNSIAGLCGLMYSQTFQVDIQLIVPLVFAVIAGGQLGLRYSLHTFSHKAIKLVTALLVFVVGIRILCFS